ncbi:uncharacterized protein PFL1_04666 [Pseudozyma flocculosa PF-1]|uniref:Zn(2)-C6 fungal-type domain-containing protein n=1 Tax=Pseudozyma flocculosa PF-1 TaxID=1277687 RepID=A0A061H4S8_9BASI|nr:uncharacterized protein PFL1_04666 [Pseudozyma flocculosa PF-1]EPQ27922.1 hypothetical protein PFL1_04666 [Pseudozyma flocculosa PF-1]
MPADITAAGAADAALTTSPRKRARISQPIEPSPPDYKHQHHGQNASRAHPQHHHQRHPGNDDNANDTTPSSSDDDEDDDADADGDQDHARSSSANQSASDHHRDPSRPTNDGTGGASASAAAAAAADAQQKKISCLVCRDAKVKCVPTTEGEPCVRCSKLGKECIFRTHKRGRKPGKIKSQQIQRRLEIIDKTLAEIQELNRDVRDPDAESLVKTLTWQLHRSKFFSKGQKPQYTRQSPQPTRSVSHNPESRANDSSADAAGAAAGVAVSAADDADAAAPSAAVRDADDRGRPVSTAMRAVHSGSSVPRHHQHPRSQSPVSRSKPSLDAGAAVARSKSDFNMLIDLEDEASIARVPDEIYTLSNPLKLLAQASGDPRLRPGGGSGSVAGAGSKKSKSASERAGGGAGGGDDDEEDDGDDDDLDEEGNPRTGEVVAETIEEVGIVSAEQAERLIQRFYSDFSTFMHIFDPHLSTIAYVRKHSAFLLTVLCATAAEYSLPSNGSGSGSDGDAAAAGAGAGGGGAEDEATPELAKALRRHVDDMMPAIMCGDYKTVEMAQGFLVLAAYQPMSDSAMSDQTWAYLGNAIRIATELGCNLCCYSLSTPKAHQQEHYQRQLRNTERLWLNLWIFEKTLSSQTGQRFHLSEDGVIAMCSSWHRQAYALPQDEALVAFVELRRIMSTQSDHFNTHILRSLTARLGPMRSDAEAGAGAGSAGSSSGGEAGGGRPSHKDSAPAFAELSSEETQHLGLQLEFFRNSVQMDLRRWEERWLSGIASTSNVAAPSSGNGSGVGGGSEQAAEGDAEAQKPTPLQIIGALYLDYAALVTYSLPLPIRYTVDVSGEMEHLYRHCYIAATGYMSVFADRCQRGLMRHITNSSVVSAVYSAVLALDLCRRASQLPFIRPRSVYAQARKVSALLQEIGQASPNRNATLRSRTVASKYSEFLGGVLDRMGHAEGRRLGDRYGSSVPRGVSSSSSSAAAAATAGAATASTGGHPGIGADADRHTSAADGFDQFPSHERTGFTPLLQASSATFDALQGSGMVLDDDMLQAYPGAIPTSASAAAASRSSRQAAYARATTASQRHSNNMHFHPGLFGPSTSSSASSSSQQAGLPIGQSAFDAVGPPPPFGAPPMQAATTAPGSSAQGNAATTPGSSTTGSIGHTAQESNALDKHWSWMMSDLDFFQLDGGDPIMDQMGRLFA